MRRSWGLGGILLARLCFFGRRLRDRYARQRCAGDFALYTIYVSNHPNSNRGQNLQNTRIHHIPVIARFSWVDIDTTHNTRSAGLDIDTTSLVELVRKDVLVVREREDELHDEFAVTGHDCTAGAPVCVFPADAVVLLVQTDDVRVV